MTGFDTEAPFQAHVIREAQSVGWMVFHVQPPPRRAPGGRHARRTAAAGFPDLVLVRPPDVVFLELKSPTGRLSDEQTVWLSALQACSTIEAWPAAPADLPHLAELLGLQPTESDHP